MRAAKALLTWIGIFAFIVLLPFALIYVWNADLTSWATLVAWIVSVVGLVWAWRHGRVILRCPECAAWLEPGADTCHRCGREIRPSADF